MSALLFSGWAPAATRVVRDELFEPWILADEIQVRIAQDPVDVGLLVHQGDPEELQCLVRVSAYRCKACPVVFVFAVKYAFHSYAYVFLGQFLQPLLPVVSAECGVRQGMFGLQLDHFLERGDRLVDPSITGVDQAQVVVEQRLGRIVIDGLLVGQQGFPVLAR